ncbi:hypothetical protein F4604DRAFT_2032389 [Suillus subluteus]|nr:hypothetical protein F4604DRAFT_2032389 [Suillus subluteus]
MNNDIPPALDSRIVTRDLTTRLCSKDHLLHGINDIMKFEHSEDHEIQRYDRKIISLTEVARSTLKRLKVELYLFVACPQALIPFKAAYFRLLLFIERRKHAFSSELDKRISRLLDPLYTRFVICCGGVDPRAQLGIEGLPAPPDVPAAWKNTIHPVVHATAVSSAQRQEDMVSDIMLPPDAFARKRERLDRLGEFIKEQSAKKFRRTRGRPMLKQYAAGNPEERRLVPKQYATGNPEATRLVPKQYATGNPEATRLVPKQYATGNPEGTRLVPKQYATGNPEATRLVPKQYATGNPEATRLVPKQYATGNPEGTRLVPKQYATGNPEATRLVPKQYATGNPEVTRLVPKQYATGNPEERRLVPKQYATGNPEDRRPVPKQYATDNPETRRLVPKQNTTGNPEERRLAPKQYAVGKPGAKRLVPQQYPAGKPGTNRALVPKHYTAGDDKLGNNVKPSCPRRVLTRTYAQYF